MSYFHFWPTVITIVVVLFILLHTIAYLILVERKVSAWAQDRLGPNRVGPWGLLQPIVDGAKFLLKEDIVPSHVDKIFFILAPAIACGTALLGFAVIPFGPTDPSHPEKYQFVIAPGVDIGFLWTFSISSLAVYGIILGGWSSNSKYSMLGALRSSAQIISYEIPLGLSVLGVVLYSGTLNLERIIAWQTEHGWNVIYQPLAFLMFLTSIFAECNRLPFDLPEAEQELVGGYHTEYSAIKFGLFFLGEYTHMITTSFLVSILFFGGWHFPLLTNGDGWFFVLMKILVIVAKASFFILFFVIIRWTLPRFRFDQLMSIAWKILIPLAVVHLVCVMTIREFQAPLIALTGVSLVLLIVAGLYAARRQPPEPVRQTGNIHAPLEEILT